MQLVGMKRTETCWTLDAGQKSASVLKENNEPAIDYNNEKTI